MFVHVFVFVCVCTHSVGRFITISLLHPCNIVISQKVILQQHRVNKLYNYRIHSSSSSLCHFYVGSMYDGIHPHTARPYTPSHNSPSDMAPHIVQQPSCIHVHQMTPCYYEPLFKELKLLNLEDIRKLQELKCYYKLVHRQLPNYFN